MSLAANVEKLPQTRGGNYEFARFNALRHGVLSQHTVLQAYARTRPTAAQRTLTISLGPRPQQSRAAYLHRTSQAACRRDPRVSML